MTSALTSAFAQGAKFEIAQEKARPVDPICLKGVEDLLLGRDMTGPPFQADFLRMFVSSMCGPRLSLGDFNEGALLHNVRQRYFDDLIYTGIGSAVLTQCGGYCRQEPVRWASVTETSCARLIMIGPPL